MKDNDAKIRLLREFFQSIKSEDLVKSQLNDGFVKSSPATGGTGRAKIEE